MSELQSMTDPMSTMPKSVTEPLNVAGSTNSAGGSELGGHEATDAGNAAFSAPVSPASNVRSVDRELLLCLRSGEPQTIGDLTKILGVTATAIRQRIERLLEIGLIDREKVVAGRGRPTFRYLLTVAGYRHAGADTSDLAEAMWREILNLSAGEVREHLITAIAKRMGGQYAAAMQDEASENAADQFARRMRQLSAMLQSREIPAAISVGNHADLPVLEIEACPYPNMTDASDDRTMCRLEEQMLSEALGKDVHLSSCRLDGDTCCQFSSKSDSDSGTSG
jgi:predicted ArsR family transcriptional regulator